MTNVVSFPGLGLEFTLNRVAIEILGRPIYWYGVIIVSGLMLAVFLCSKWSGRFGINEDQIIDLMLFAVPAALVAIRAYYVIFNLDFYRLEDGSLDWAAILRFSDGGLAIYGAIISSAIVLLIFCRVRKISFMPWRMCSESIAREMLYKGYVDAVGYESILSGSLGVHPTFFYESAWNLVGLILVYFMGKKRKFDGQCFLFYVFWYGLGRTWIEGLRTDSLYFFGLELFGMPIRTSQLLAAVSALVAVVFLLWMLARGGHKPENLYVNRIAAQAAETETSVTVQEMESTDDSAAAETEEAEPGSGEKKEE